MFRKAGYILFVSASAIALLLSSGNTVDWFFPLLLGVFLIFSNAILRKYLDYYWFVHPSSMILNYIGFSVLIGSMAFYVELVAIPEDLSAYKAWKLYNLTSALFVLLLGTFVLGSVSFVKRKIGTITKSNNRQISLLVLVPLLIFFFIPLDLSVIGGDGDFAIVVKTAIAIFFIYKLSFLQSSKLRWLFYFSIVFFFSLFSIQEKREAIFLFFPILYLEVLKRSFEFSFKTFLFAMVGISFTMVLIISMSVARGYGGYGEDLSLIEAFFYIDDYMISPGFLLYLGQNIETNYTFFHALNSMELVLSNSDLLAFGSTFIKVFFIPFPRYLFPYKPSSILELYTSTYSPSFRLEGGSWVIPVFSEFIWNFSFLGLFASYLFGKCLNFFNNKLVASIFSGRSTGAVHLLFVYTILFTYVRGSGLDQFVLYWLIGFVVFLYYNFTKKIIKCVGY